MKINQDKLQRFIFENTAVRGNFANLTKTFQQALNKQILPDGLKCALGELMVASALLSATLKMNGSLILQIQSKGTLKLLVVECNSEFGIRATAKWSSGDTNHPITDKHSLFDLIENGQFMITLDPKNGGQAYQGIVPLEGESISQILENYMLRSEQIDTKIWLFCDGKSAGGLLIQKLPETMNQVTQKEYDPDIWNRISHLASTLTEVELLNLPAEILLTRLFHEEDIRLFEATPTRFHCSCTRESVSAMLRMLGQEELTSILEEIGRIDVNCDFCNTLYTFDQVDTTELIITEAPVPGSPEIH